MVEIYNDDLLEKAGLLVYRGEDYITIYTNEMASGGFENGDIIISKDGNIMCRYRYYELTSVGSVVHTDEFLIKRDGGRIEKHRRESPQSGIGYVNNYRLATYVETKFFQQEMSETKTN